MLPLKCGVETSVGSRFPGNPRLNKQTSNLLYEVISTRHSQKRSTIISTNTPISDWGIILFNTTFATAIADRLVENSEILLLGGDSLRKPNKNSNPPADE